MLHVPSYLERIAYHGPTSPTSGTLRALHRAHLMTVPFENLDISLGRKIVLDEEALVHKVVAQRRGGFCYELNGAFAALLHAMGFRVTLLSARVAGKEGKESPEFDHLTLLVDLEESWLADVGFGELFFEPLRLDSSEQTDPAGVFRLLHPGERWQLQKSEPVGQWKHEYSFTLESRTLEDFSARCVYHQTSLDSHFTQNRICTRATPKGRITLSGMNLIITRNGLREATSLPSEEERSRVLLEHFGVRL